jgi:hypothetical protein
MTVTIPVAHARQAEVFRPAHGWGMLSGRASLANDRRWDSRDLNFDERCSEEVARADPCGQSNKADQSHGIGKQCIPDIFLLG